MADLKSKLRTASKKVAYAQPVREAVRRVAALEKPATLDKIISHSPLAQTLRSIESESLPAGKTYIRLRIEDWQPILGESFRFYYRDELLYGNVVEQPEKAYPLEYRNIVGPSTDPSDYSVRLVSGKRAGESLDFEVAFGQGTFTTQEQVLYDERFKIRKHGRAYYALRGNTKDPEKIIFSFPGLGMSVGRIVYPVSSMKDVRNADLANALMVVFQDRYLVPGSYMLLDSLGQSIHADISDVIRGFMDLYGIAQRDLFFFGASKGASTAIYYALDFPEAELLVSTPQLHLPSYFVKPALRDNLFIQRGFHTITSAGELLRQYIREGRRVHVFYTNNDELSNQSYIEFEEGGERLSKYRIPGVHTAVARDALGSIVGIMKRFLGTDINEDTPERTAEVTSIEIVRDSLVRVRARLSEPVESKHYFWYLRRPLDQGEQLYMLNMAADKQTLYTSAEGLFNLDLDSLHGQWSLRGEATDGSTIDVPLNGWDEALEASGVRSTARLTEPMVLDLSPTTTARTYVVVNRYKVAEFSYNVERGEDNSHFVEVFFIDELPATPQRPGDARVRVYVNADSDQLADVFAMRIIAREGAGALRVCVDLADPARHEAMLRRMRDLDWKHVEVVDGERQ